MTDAELLEKVKTRLGITGDFQDEAVQGFIDDTKAFLKDAGISSEVLMSDASVGVISRGVADTWNYGAGDGEFSKMFYQRAEQLRHEVEVSDNV